MVVMRKTAPQTNPTLEAETITTNPRHTTPHATNKNHSKITNTTITLMDLTKRTVLILTPQKLKFPQPSTALCYRSTVTLLQELDSQLT